MSGGLEFLPDPGIRRGSVPRSSGFDIVERGVADAGSLLQAMALAAEIAARRG